VFSPLTDCGGLYHQPGDYELCIDGRFYDGCFGIIVIGEHEGAAATIAHEWRHHWQRHNGLDFDNVPLRPDLPYEENIRQYFRRSKSELDALLFERREAPNYINDYWMHLTFA
jgi:hypothetical protein